jgi:eukaryotic-like serine/threonine-protein kinase
MEIRLCPRCARAEAAPATRCPDCGVALQVHDERHLIGSSLGSYTLERVLGSGGMGVVFAARHQSLLREAAIKVLQPELDARAGSAGEFAQRFLREARLLATLEHPNIVGIYDFAVSPWGFPYLVMPRLRGETLRGLLARHPYGLARGWIAAIAGDIAAGLAHAHRHGVVHRDLKPENVFLALEADGLRARLLDFGIAHAADHDDLMRTATGTLMGTPLYQAPEQLRGESVSAATDQYSFALLYAEMLRGTPVRQGLSLTDILLRDSARPLPADALPEAIDGATRHALARATAPLPQDRYADLGSLLADLALPPPERDPLLAAIDDGSSALALTVMVSAPRDRQAAVSLVPTTPPPAQAGQRTSAPDAQAVAAALSPQHATSQAASAAQAPSRYRTRLTGLLLALAVFLLLTLGGFAWWRGSGSGAAAASTAWLRETGQMPLPPGLLAPLAELRSGLVLRSTGGWTLFDPATRSSGASAALGVAEQLLGVDDESRLWLGHDGSIEALELDSNRRSTVLSGATLLAGDAQTRWGLSPSGRWLGRLDAEGRFRLLRVQDSKVEEWIDSPGPPGDSIRFVLGDRHAVLIRPSRQIEVFDLEQRRSAWRADFAPYRVRAAALDETLDRIAVAGDGEHLAIWQLADGTAAAAPSPARELRALLWIADGPRLLAADAQQLTVYQWQQGKPVATQQLPGGADWLYRGTQAIYAGGSRGLVRYAFGPAPQRRIAADIGDTWAMAADASTAYAGGSRDGSLVRAARGAGEVQRREVHNAGITDLQLIGDRLVSASDDRTIGVWRLPALELEWRAKGHAFLVNQLALGSSLWSSSSDGSLRRWRWPELELLETLDLRTRVAADLELHGLHVSGTDAEILAGTWNHRVLALRRQGDQWQIRSAPFESRTGYRLVDLPQLQALLLVGIHPGRLALIDRRDGDRVELLPRDTDEWHAASADPDGRSAWLGGAATLARLQFTRREDGRFAVTRALRESSDYGEIGSIAVMPAAGADGESLLAFGNEHGELMFVPTADVDTWTSASIQTQAAEGFSALDAPKR